jgi:hypothetical protein
LFGSAEETLADLFPGFGVGFCGEAVGGFVGVVRFDAGDPVESDLLPEGEVPELGVDGVGDIEDFAVSEFVGEAFEDVRGRGGVAFGDEGLG